MPKDKSKAKNPPNPNQRPSGQGRSRGKGLHPVIPKQKKHNPPVQRFTELDDDGNEIKEADSSPVVESRALETRSSPYASAYAVHRAPPPPQPAPAYSYHPHAPPPPLPSYSYSYHYTWQDTPYGRQMQQVNHYSVSNPAYGPGYSTSWTTSAMVPCGWMMMW